MDKEDKLKMNSFLSFKLGEEIFAANVSKVLNILEMVKITKVPKCPDYMKGVINLRGSILPVIDTRIKLGMTVTEMTANTCILVLDIDYQKDSIHIGGLVDSVQEVLEIDPDKILPPPNIGSKFQSEFIYGMYKFKEDQFIMLLDMDKLFSTEDFENINDITPIVEY
ncbi:MAG: chemotaxis protein CheW [Bacteroidetes bacterium HGW-Bacteroidetes-21]|jgi:purine-binding chemotaxis protein CheW|nr:MAG: chemotaxis protein CheW [Bacteroidetes bacterium HGW-Bacteroidetes-21]